MTSICTRADVINILPEPILGLLVNTLGVHYRINRYSAAMRGKLMDWQSIERCSESSLRAFQLRRLKQVLEAAAKTPYYRRVFKQVGFDPEAVSSVTDLQRLPLLGKSDLIEHGRDMLVPGYGAKLVSRRSSGTSGQPVTYLQPHRMAFHHNYAMLYQFYNWHGFKPLGRRATIAGRYLGNKPKGVVLRNRFENQLLLGVHSLSEGSVARYLAELDAFKPDILQAHPSALLLLKQLSKAADLPAPKLALVTFTAETLPDAERASLMKWLGGATIFGTYGSGENVVSAGECATLSGYHIHPAVGICELVDVGGEREIVGTSLLNDAMPLLRYRTGDIAGGISHSPCPCGCTWPRITGLQGRIDDSLDLPNGDRIASVVLRTGIASLGALEAPYSLVQHKEPGRYTLQLYCDDDNAQLHLHGVEAVKRYLRKLLGDDSRISVRFAPLNQLLTSRAKHRIVVKESV